MIYSVTRERTDDEDNFPRGVTMSDFQCKVFAGVFVLMGTSALYYWNCVVNALYSILTVKYPEYPSLFDSITSSYASIAFVTSVALSIAGPLRMWINFAGGVVLAAASISFPVAVLTMQGRSGFVALHIMAGVAGLAEACFQVSAFAFSVILPRPFAGWVSLGYGLCGVVTFSSWMLFSQGIHDVNTMEQREVAGALWCHMSLATILILISIAIFQTFFRLPLAKQAFIKAIASRDEEQQCGMMEDGGKRIKRSHGRLRRSIKIFRTTWVMQVGLAVSMGLSMMAYPLIGPFRWGNNIIKTDTLIGVFQTCDFLGRYIPQLSAFIPWLLIPRKLLVTLTALRVVIVGLFVWVAVSTRRGDRGFWQQYWVQVSLMLAMSLSHGWYATVYLTRIPEGLTHPRDKARALAMGVSLLTCMIAVGLWCAKLVCSIG